MCGYLELCAVSDVEVRDVGRIFTKIKKLKIYKKSSQHQPQAESFLERFCSMLKLPPQLTKAAIHVVEKAQTYSATHGYEDRSSRAFNLMLIAYCYLLMSSFVWLFSFCFFPVVLQLL